MSNDITAVGSLIQIISRSRQNALKKVNEELINMYWRVGEYLSKESAKAASGYSFKGKSGRGTTFLHLFMRKGELFGQRTVKTD